MTDLENMLFLKLRPASDHRLADLTEPILAEGERVLQPFQGIATAWSSPTGGSSP